MNAGKSPVVEYKGFLIVGGRHARSGVAYFRVLRPKEDCDEVVLVVGADRDLTHL